MQGGYDLARVDTTFVFLFFVAFKGGARSRTEDKFLFEFGDKTIYPSPPCEGEALRFHKGVSSAVAFDTTILSVLKLHACTITIIYYQFAKNTIKLFHCLFFQSVVSRRTDTTKAVADIIYVHFVDIGHSQNSSVPWIT